MRTALTTLVVAVVLGACDQAQGPNVPSPTALAGEWSTDEYQRSCNKLGCVGYSSTGQLTFAVSHGSVSGTYEPSGGSAYPISDFTMTKDGDFSFGIGRCRWSGTLPPEPITTMGGAVSCPYAGGQWSAVRVAQ